MEEDKEDAYSFIHLFMYSHSDGVYLVELIPMRFDVGCC